MGDNTKTVFVVAFAPDPNHGSVGGHDWYYKAEAAAEAFKTHSREHPTDYLVLFPLVVEQDADNDTITDLAQEKADAMEAVWTRPIK